MWGLYRSSMFVNPSIISAPRDPPGPGPAQGRCDPNRRLTSRPGTPNKKWSCKAWVEGRVGECGGV